MRTWRKCLYGEESQKRTEVKRLCSRKRGIFQRSSRSLDLLLARFASSKIDALFLYESLSFLLGNFRHSLRIWSPKFGSSREGAINFADAMPELWTPAMFTSSKSTIRGQSLFYYYFLQNVRKLKLWNIRSHWCTEP